jgi:hypothetical protein
MRKTAIRLIGIVVAAAFVSGCGERSGVTSPAAVAGSSHSASAVIGAFGGQLTLPSAGLTVVVPPFAVASPTRITVTAVAGNQVAYELDPHGTRLLVPLVVTQRSSSP